jgi:hypothetical protein
MLLVSQMYIALNVHTREYWGRIDVCKVAAVWFNILSLYLPGRTEESHEILQSE